MSETFAESSIFDSLADQCMFRCEQIADQTDSPGHITRLFLTTSIRKVHDILTRQMEALHMEVRTDAAGNLIGRRRFATSAKRLLIGSHLDTVPGGGKYDGALGVVVGLAVVEALRDDSLPFDLEVIGLSEEEGVRFAIPYLGSRAIAGSFEDDWLDRTDRQGVSMRSVIQAFGLDPDRIPDAAYPAQSVVGFVETHIEQGPVLRRVDRPVAAVEAIAGQSRLLVRFNGKPGHAGTTPMMMRHDALVTAARWIVHVREYAEGVDGLRATVGYVDVFPNVRNVIPATVGLSIDIRHASDQVRMAADQSLCQEACRMANDDDLQFEVVERQSQPAAQMDARLSDELLGAISDCGAGSFKMVSGAGHDAAAMSERFPTALLFVRQPKGISHHPDEDVRVADVAVAIAVLVRMVRRLAKRHRKEA